MCGKVMICIKFFYCSAECYELRYQIIQISILPLTCFSGNIPKKLVFFPSERSNMKFNLIMKHDIRLGHPFSTNKVIRTLSLNFSLFVHGSAPGAAVCAAHGQVRFRRQIFHQLLSKDAWSQIPCRILPPKKFLPLRQVRWMIKLQGGCRLKAAGKWECQK